jgi:hypothetical protein
MTEQEEVMAELMKLIGPAMMGAVAGAKFLAENEDLPKSLARLYLNIRREIRDGLGAVRDADRESHEATIAMMAHLQSDGK